MSYPKLELTRFNRVRASNNYHDHSYYPVGSEFNRYLISDYMADCIQAVENGPQPRYWSFAKFSKKAHKKDAITANTAIVLEYPLHKKSELEMELAELKLAHYLIQTDDTKTNMVAAIIPRAYPLMNTPGSNRYSRLASVLIEQIGIDGVTDGCQSCTVLIKPINKARVEAFLGDFIDPETYIKDTADMNARAKRYIDSAKPVDAPSDELFAWPK